MSPTAQGTHNGSSYANAWGGFDQLIWGEGGVSAGDTLVVSGTFIYPDNMLKGLVIGANGSAGNYITINGNDGIHPQGVIIGARKMASANFLDNNDNTFSANISFNAPLAWQGDPTGTPKLLKIATSKDECIQIDGSFYVDTLPTPDVLYVNPYGLSIEDIYYNWADNIAGNGYDYIYLKNLRLFGASSSRGIIQLSRVGAAAGNGARHWIIEDSELAFGGKTGIYAQAYSTDDIQILDSNIHRVPTGTYPTAEPGIAHTNWVFDGIEIYSGEDLDNIYGWTRSDRHALGGQGLAGALFQNNYIHDWAGDGILVGGSLSPITNVTVRNNRIFNLNDNDSANYHWAIAQALSNATDYSKRSAGWKVYNNLIQNCGPGATGYDGVAFYLKGKSDIQIYNNTVRNCLFGIHWLNVSQEIGMQFTAKNNIFADMPAASYYLYGGVSTGDVNIVMNNNLYSADTSGTANKWMLDYVDSTNFLDWKSDSLQDANSLLGNPGFVNAAAGNFRLLSGSSAINAGQNLSAYFNDDFDGNPRPTAGVWAIGAFEFAGELPSCNLPQILCGGICVTPVCSSSAECDDHNPSTIDSCNNSGTCTASCTHTSARTCFDLTSDGKIDLFDLVFVALRIGNATGDPADVKDNDGVNISDLQAVAGQFGQTC
ncbi:MAG: right-handed parallel beta-helix repeat-containing protein [Candidatus Diapherotrites archaeon]|nr:right-handed parallel beta-helix repeat-containing protein [Candidatus Diapherotrites archaeon]